MYPVKKMLDFFKIFLYIHLVPFSQRLILLCDKIIADSVPERDNREDGDLPEVGIPSQPRYCDGQRTSRKVTR